MCRFLLEAEVVSKFRHLCVLYIDHTMYDEPPMVASIKVDNQGPTLLQLPDNDADAEKLEFAASLYGHIPSNANFYRPPRLMP